MTKFAVYDISYDLHVLVPMWSETTRWGHEILVDHAQTSKAHPVGVME
jgi:hypothetical protein